MDYLCELITLGMDGIIFAICLREYRRCGYAIDALKNAELRQVGPELVNLVESCPEEKIPYVAVTGVVKPIGQPLMGLSNKYISAVIQKIKIKEHVIVRATTGFWTGHKQTVYKMYNTVPFVLRKGSYSVEVIDPLSADILDLDVVSDKFEPSVPSFMDHLWGFFTGIRKMGLHATEELLREGTVMTGIGQLSKSGSGPNALRLQAPENGTPFYLTTMSVSSLINKLDDHKKTYRTLCLIFGTIGMAVSVIVLRRYWKGREAQEFPARRRERRQRVREKDLRDDQKCVVCCTNPLEVILLPCGHVCLCEDCAENISSYCPVCRTRIHLKNAAYIA